MLVTPVLFLAILTFGLAAFGKSLGIRKLYVKVLVSIFEYARKASQKAQVIIFIFYNNEFIYKMIPKLFYNKGKVNILTIIKLTI